MSCGTKGDHPHIFTPVKAIRHKCLDCCCGSSQEVEHCPVTDCALYPYRFGKRPAGTGRQLTDEERAAKAENLAKARARKAHGSY
jgi:hypothetical protein